MNGREGEREFGAGGGWGWRLGWRLGETASSILAFPVVSASRELSPRAGELTRWAGKLTPRAGELTPPPLRPPPPSTPIQASNRNEGYCHHPSLVGTICTEMPKMKGCEPWNALCRRGSAVPHCLRPGPLPDAPSTPDATKAVQAMCSSHSMPGCEACRQGAAAGAEGCREPLAALAAVCASMPGMRDCKQLAAACSGENAATFFPKTCALLATSPGGKKTKGEKTAGGSASLAGSGAPLPSSFDLPPMRMFLHADTEDIVLARQWVPRSPGAVAAACLGAIAGGFLSQALRAARGAAEAAVAARLLRGGEGGLFSSPAAGARLGRNALRAAATFASSLLDLLLMLIAMTFSWPLILSVAAGYGLGALVFGALGEPRLGDGGARGESGDGRPPSAAADGFATSEGVHLHGGTEGLDGASCCDMGGEREREGEKEKSRFRTPFFLFVPLVLLFFFLLTQLLSRSSLSFYFSSLSLNSQSKIGGIGRAKLSPTPGGNGDAAKGRGGWFGKP